VGQPRKTEIGSDGGLSILWDDGHGAVYTPARLRLACKCALCEDEWSGERRLQAGSVPADIRALGVKPVGRYGLQITWSDGHSTGIYTFDRLRPLCECAICRRSPRG
jgi:ATP-binding protein involved in chromosome partitioning